jgi:hypothetical protein
MHMLPASNRPLHHTTTDSGHRHRILRRMLAACLLFVVLLTPAFAQQDIAQQHALEWQKIDYLIASVAGLQDARFIRNGTAYDAQRAASHMRLKLRFSGDRVQTAEDFIAYCATDSSASGIRYTIRFADGHTVDSATFLRGKLAEYNANHDTH